MKFTATLTKQSPAYDERNGITYEIEANNKAQAARYARRQAEGDGHIGQGQGRYSIKCEELVEGDHQ